MDCNTTCNKKGGALIHYLEKAGEGLGAEYAAACAYRVFGGDIESGDALISLCKGGDVLDIIRSMEQEPRDCPSHTFNLLRNGDLKEVAKRVWAAQTDVCLPLIEQERCCFIDAEYGRLMAILGVDYWDGETNEYKVIWKYDTGGLIDVNDKDRIKTIGAAVDDPYDLDLHTLSKIGYFDKRMEMLGTVSYTPFYRMRPSDRDRLVVLYDCEKRLRGRRLLSEDELKRLFEGHDCFMDR